MAARWRWAVTAAPLVAMAPAVTILLTDERLPDPVAVHFGPAGAADSFASHPVAALVPLTSGLAFAAVSWFFSGPTWGVGARTGRPIPVIAFLLGATALLAVVTTAGTVAQVGLADARAATLPLWMLGVALVVGVAVGVVVARLAPRPDVPAEESVEVPAEGIGPTERISWSERISAPGLIATGVGLLGGAVAAIALASPLAGIGPMVLGLALLTSGTARAIIDRRGLTVAFGPGWPRLQVPTEDIRTATVADVTAARYGGLGYRIVSGGIAVLFRSGPALVVHRRNGRWLTVTVDRPETPAALLNGLVRQP